MTPADDSGTSTLDIETVTVGDREPVLHPEVGVRPSRPLRIALLSYR